VTLVLLIPQKIEGRHVDGKELKVPEGGVSSSGMTLIQNVLKVRVFKI
jgi:hypothetical protein